MKLINYSTDKVVSEDKEIFKNAIEVLEDCGASINKTTVKIIHEDISNYSIRCSQLEQAIKKCFSEENFFSWSNVLKHTGKTKTTTFRPYDIHL